VRFLVAAWLLLITAVSLAPLRLKLALHTVGVWHNPIHFAVFLATGLLALSTASSFATRGLRTAYLILFCAATELLEALLFHNPFEWRDLSVDSLGLCSGWLLIMLFWRPMAAQF
jgi:hypothetical protein